ncbi:MAG: cytochrome ubiquinol oxidase subunit I [Desulfuromonas sp.]|nr:cytochrome ubiquinol oxidase subunit I [Desulfuromonas thiophila]MDY0397527.1 cytochrome ubiquinol oxidase subunit I [Desulfuromonas thiophila]
MLEQLDVSQLSWARGQFALTAMYHWIFVPLTLGLSFLLAFFETLYVKTGNEQWKRITKFWMTLFGINFAIGVATGIIMEFEFGTNWSNYSWMVGDIFGAPLAAEGIFAFFLETTFFAVMFFGWNRVSKGFHLLSTWLVAIGSNLSALWILVANGWMQHPVGMQFNPDRARFEMESFWQVLLSPVAVSHFVHTTSSAFLLSALFVVTVSCWYLLKGRHVALAKKSLAVAATFGLISSAFVAFTGDESAYTAARVQPMKLAAMEGLWDGEVNADLVAVGIVNPGKKPGDDSDPFQFEIKLPYLLSLLANRELGSFVPGINDLVYGNAEQGIEGAGDRIARGKQAISLLATYKQARDEGDAVTAEAVLQQFNQVRDDIGYGYLSRPEDIVPPVPLVFYSFHVMVALGTLFPLLFGAILFFLYKDNLSQQKWFLRLGVLSVFFGYLASQAGWIVAEVGRQPWAIQGLLPVGVARSNLTTTTVQMTFFMFLIIFTTLLIAEVRIMTRQIQNGPEGE